MRAAAASFDFVFGESTGKNFDPVAFIEGIDHRGGAGLVLALGAVAVVDENRRAFDAIAQGSASASAFVNHVCHRTPPGRECPKGGGPSSRRVAATIRSEEHTSELQSLMRISYAVFCLKQKNK